MSEAVADDPISAEAERLRGQMTLCFWGWAALFTVSCGLILMGEPWSMGVGFVVMNASNFFRFCMPVPGKTVALMPNPATTEPLTLRNVALGMIGLAVFLGLIMGLGPWIPDTPANKAKVLHFFSHPLLVLPFWGWLMWGYFQQYRQAMKAGKCDAVTIGDGSQGS